MRYINVDDDYVGQILAANQLAESKDLNESQEVEVVEEACEDGHICPLCESELDAPISEEAMQECVDFILGTINEALEQEGESLEEDEDLDEAEHEDEEDDEMSDKKKKMMKDDDKKKEMKDKEDDE
ncbi:hypothetical protein [Marinobacter sp.]|jgi:hypothetical protein|uniref:hypothetical protein n=1 Tax=Marinobacter sp. TaxID=50741 RepID=UPI000C89EA1A|nr:hypothetical protein [Marinobacter sp.]MAK50913.1 hypothetical protein [Marinobacter sp.]